MSHEAAAALRRSRTTVIIARSGTRVDRWYLAGRRERPHREVRHAGRAARIKGLIGDEALVLRTPAAVNVDSRST